MAEAYPYKWWALIGLSLLSFTAFLDYTIVATALPFIQKDLQASVLELQWVTNIFVMVVCMFMIIVGKAGDLFGRKRIFYFGFVVFAIAAFGAGFAPTINQLIFFRAVQGFAGAIIFTLAVALLPQAFPLKEQTRAIGIFSAFNGAGLAIGPPLGGLLISFLSWRWVFWINIPIIVIGILCCSFSLKSSQKIIRSKRITIDWWGFLLLILTLGCLVYGLIHGEQVGWNHVATWAYLSIGILAFILLPIVELNVPDPLLDLSIFQNHHTFLAILICIIAGLITSVFMFFDPLYLELMRKQSALLIGLTLLSVPIVQVIISLVLEKLLRFFNIYNLLIFGLFTAFLSALCHFAFTPTVSIFVVLLGLMLMGYSWGIANAGTITAVTSSVPHEKFGASIGTVFTFWNLSGAIFLALGSIIFHFREQAFFYAQLEQTKLQLTQDQQQTISLLLSDPEHATATLAQTLGPQAMQILPIFTDSFMSAFHTVAACSAIFMLIVLLLGMRLRK